MFSKFKLHSRVDAVKQQKLFTSASRLLFFILKRSFKITESYAKMHNVLYELIKCKFNKGEKWVLKRAEYIQIAQSLASSGRQSSIKMFGRVKHLSVRESEGGISYFCAACAYRVSSGIEMIVEFTKLKLSCLAQICFLVFEHFPFFADNGGILRIWHW